jgi:hypothetical protein
MGYPVPKDALQSSPVYRTYAAGAQDLTNEGPNAGSIKGQMPRAIMYSGAMTVVDHTGEEVDLIPVTDYFVLTIQVAEVVSSDEDYMVMW